MHIDPIRFYARAKPKRVALIGLDEEIQLTWVELDAAINQTAYWLITQFGPASGVRVATLAKNTSAMIILQFACVRAGAIFVPFNWRLAPPEVDALIADAMPSLLFYGADFNVKSHAALSYLITDVQILTKTHSRVAPADNTKQDWDAPSTILYTSGTSGKPKGVMISEANAYWGSANFSSGNSVSDESAFLCDMPLFHTAGLFAASRTALQAGGMLYLSKGFDPEVSLARLTDSTLGITHYFSVPQMAQIIWNRPEFRPELLQGLKVYATGGAPNPRAQIERFVGAGVPMSDGFGMTETCSVSGMPLADFNTVLDKAGSIGLPYVSIDAKIVDDHGSEVSNGERGELWLRGPSISRGYWNQPEVTAAAFHNGWFKTGDAAMRDADGYFYLVDRKKDMYISGGENVYPAEVEAAIAELADIAECAVVGVPDPQWGEVGRAYIVMVADRTLSAATITAHCVARLAKFKVPKHIIIADSIPRTATGKVQKHLLKE